MTLLCFLVVDGNNSINKNQQGIVHAVQNVEDGERQDKQVLSQPQEQLDIISKTPDQTEQVKSEEDIANKLQNNKTVVAATTEESNENDQDSNTEEGPQVSGQGVSCTSRDLMMNAEDTVTVTAVTAQTESGVSISNKNRNGGRRDLRRKTTHDETDLPVTNVIATPDQDFGENEKTSTMGISVKVQELTMKSTSHNDSDLNVMQETATSPDQDITDHEKPSTIEKSEEKQEETNSAATIIACNDVETIAEKLYSVDTEFQVPENQLTSVDEASEHPGPSVNYNQSVNKEMDQRKYSQQNSSTDIEELTADDLDQTDNFNQEKDTSKQKSTEDTVAELHSETSRDENEKRLNSETALPQFGYTNSEPLMAESSVRNESVLSHAGPQQQENSSPCGEESKLQLKDSGSPSAISEVKNSETEAAIKLTPSRDRDAENRLITALRLSCKLSPGHLVRDLDVKSVMSVHLLRSLSPGVVTVAELVHKLVYLTELDLSGNLLGPQGFRVICLALRRNTTLKSLNLANNLADTDSSVSTETKVGLS